MKIATQIVALVLLAVSASIAIGACGDDPETTPEGEEAGLPDGTVVLPDGAIIFPDGAVVLTDGGVLLSDGAVVLSDGAVIFPEAGPDGGDDSGMLPDAQPDANAPETGTSCVGVAATCGGNKDCCASNVVAGGTFNRSSEPGFPATVSSFKLDVYEVTVGRFRSFVNAGKGTQANPPAAGDGAHPKIAASGWSATYNAMLPANTATLKADLKCSAGYPAWTDAPAGNETKPMNCITWFDAFAFCAWDGGRLPTEAEWNYAAAGGSEQRLYPFGATIDQTKAAYFCSGKGVGQCVFADMLPVGSKSPAGDGKWGQADLAGNSWEWTLDFARTPYRLTACVDCADLQSATNRTFRGGGFPNEDFYQRTSVRLEDIPTDRDYDVGVRCARASGP